jgi:hypothetical protein
MPDALDDQAFIGFAADDCRLTRVTAQLPAVSGIQQKSAFNFFGLRTVTLETSFIQNRQHILLKVHVLSNRFHRPDSET